MDLVLLLFHIIHIYRNIIQPINQLIRKLQKIMGQTIFSRWDIRSRPPVIKFGRASGEWSTVMFNGLNFREYPQKIWPEIWY